MNLLIDLKATQPSYGTKRHGGGRYGEVIFLRMAERDIRFACMYDSRLWFNPEIEEVCREKQIPLYDVARESVEDIIKKHQIDRLYSCLAGKLGRLTCCEVYGTVHGLRDLETPYDSIFYRYRNSFMETVKFTIKKMFIKQFRRYKHRQLEKNFSNKQFHFATVSEHTYYALFAFFPELKGRKIPVFYSPSTSREVNVTRSKDATPYLLLVSGNRWEKNNLRAIEAFDRLLDYGLIEGVRMKVTGVPGKEKFRYRFRHPESFDFLGYVDDDELEQLYADAYLFVYPTLNEGFGYPPMEAMRYKVPVISSPLSSLAEICGSGALYFDPFSVEEIMNRMMMMMNPDIHQSFSEKGYQQYQRVHERQTADLDGIIDYIIG